MMEMDNFSSEFSFEAKSFLECCCKNVIKNAEVVHQKENMRLFSERLFYSQFVDKIQIKFFAYKLNEQKMKLFAENNFYERNTQADSEKRKIWEESKKSTQSFFDSVSKKTLTEYNKYTARVLFYVITLQKRFRGYLYRFIHKIELMNYKMELEMKKAEERAKQKVIARRASSVVKK